LDWLMGLLIIKRASVITFSEELAMNGRRNVLMIVLVFVGGLIGGAISGRLFSGVPALASMADLSQPPYTGPGQPDPRKVTLRARRLELIDEEGRPRAILQVTAKGAPSLAFYDKKGSGTVILGANPDQSAMLLFRGREGSKAKFAIEADGSPTMVLFDRKGKARSILRLSPGGEPLLALQDERQRTRVVLGAITADVAGRTLGERPISSLALFDENEKPLWQVP